MSDILEHAPVTQLKGVGSQMAAKLAKVGVHNLADLFFHLPLRYLDQTRLTPITDLRPHDQVVVEGEIVSSQVQPGRRPSLACRLRDDSGLITLRFYFFNQALRQRLAEGKRLRAFGECRRGRDGLELYHPEIQPLGQAGEAMEDSLTPIYPSTAGLSQQRWRSLMDQALPLLEHGALDDLLPDSLTQRFGDIKQALQYLHAPPPDASCEQLANGSHPFQQRLALEELMAHHLSLLQLRQQAQSEPAAPLPAQPSLADQLLQRLPFQPTNAQRRVWNEVAQDLQLSQPMLRLVQGDVGSGKTLVAALSALHAVEAGLQVAMMAPTELLAEQHYQTLQQWLSPLGVQVDWLSGRIKGQARKRTLTALANGETQLMIGTHALFQDEVQFHSLALVIIDEQHRFGVHQRLSLREKGRHVGLVPHQLIMTATPIPRTLAMSVYADLDCSIIDELPPGRTPVTTVALPNERRPQVIQRVRNACLNEQRQVYWVCTLIDESEELQCQAAEATAEELQRQLPDLNVDLVHGRMKAADKAAAMERFSTGDTHVLVATTVIEVGVDVPNASVMIIENPERLGLAQLHQLRGRVGRGSVASHCILMYAPPLSQQSQARIQAMRDSNDGFYLAEQDLRLRGPGEVLGTRQTGLVQFRIADLQRDANLLQPVKQAAAELLHSRPENVEPLIQRWFADNEQFANI